MTSSLAPKLALLTEEAAGGHLDHWAAILGKDLSGLQRLVEVAVPGCEIVPPHAASARALSAAGEPLAFALLRADRSGGTEASGLLCVVQVSADAHGQPTLREIRTAYPHFAAGTVVVAELREIALFPSRLEARLRLDLGNGAACVAFDSFYWRNRGRYGAGRPARFALAALAYTMAPASPGKVTPDDFTGPAALLDGKPDDRTFHGTVVGVTPEAMRILDTPLWRVEVHLGRLPDGREPVLPVHVSAAGFAGDWRPAAGDTVSGTLWLQTRLVETPGAE